jgi:hypothetical protein
MLVRTAPHSKGIAALTDKAGTRGASVLLVTPVGACVWSNYLEKQELARHAVRRWLAKEVRSKAFGGVESLQRMLTFPVGSPLRVFVCAVTRLVCLTTCYT